jgi:hypothetical protein
MSLARSSYRIADEPVASKLSRLVVNPVFPLLGGMLGGFGVGVVWFVVNGVGMGSATLRRELWVAFMGLALAVLGTGVLFMLYDARPQPSGTVLKLAALGLTLVKLVVLYVLQLTQSRSFALHQHFGGHVANGILPVIGALILRTQLFEVLPTAVAVVLQ